MQLLWDARVRFIVGVIHFKIVVHAFDLVNREIAFLILSVQAKVRYLEALFMQLDRLNGQILQMLIAVLKDGFTRVPYGSATAAITAHFKSELIRRTVEF